MAENDSRDNLYTLRVLAEEQATDMEEMVVLTAGQLGKTITALLVRSDNISTYAVGDVVSSTAGSVITFTDVAEAADAQFLINGIRMRIDAASIPSGIGNFRLHLYKAEPTAIADNTAFNLPAADRDKYLGYITIPTPADLGDTLWAQDDNLNVRGRLGATTSLYGILETLAAYTPTASTVKTIILYTMGV